MENFLLYGNNKVVDQPVQTNQQFCNLLPKDMLHLNLS